MIYKQEIKMNFTEKAKKAVAAGLAVSTLMWAAALFVAMPAQAATHSEGCLVLSGGTVYLITGGQKRGFTSAEVFMSHGYNFGQVIAANSDDAALPTGPIMIYANGTLVKGPNDPLVYLVVNGQKRGFTSGAVFTGLGYSFANIQWAPVNTFSDIPTGANIDATTNGATLPKSGPGAQSVNCSTSGGGSTGGLEGGAGSIDSTDLVSGLSNEEVGEGDEEVEVAGLEVEAGDDSDIRLTSVRLVLDEVGSGNDDFEDYAEELTLTLDGDVVATVDADEFNDDNDWTKNVTLSNAVIRAGETGELIVAVTAVENLDSGDIDGTDGDWTVDFTQLRFVDALGSSITETVTENAVTFDFVSFASSADVEMQVRLNNEDEDINDAHIIRVDDNDETNDVELLSFEIEAEGDSDIMIDEIPVVFTTVEAAGTHFDDPADVITEVRLLMNGEEVGTESLTDAGSDDTETVTFDDLDLTVEAGETVEFTVEVDLIALSGVLDAGDTVRAQITSTQVDAIDAEDESGEELDTIANGARSGSALAEASAVYSTGISVELVSVSAVETSSADAENEVDEGTYVIKYEVTAFGNDVYVDGTVTEDGDGTYAAGQGNSYFIQNPDGTSAAAGTTPTAAGLSSTADSAANTTWLVEEDTTETFTLTVTVSNTFAGDASSDAVQAQVALMSIGWDTSAIAATTQNYTFNLSEFETDPLTLSEIDNA